jgi:hypothetical protein
MACDLESVIGTSELELRSNRTPDQKAESQAEMELTLELARAPHDFFQKLVNMVLKLSLADSAGISLLDEKNGRFVWPAVAGGLDLFAPGKTFYLPRTHPAPVGRGIAHTLSRRGQGSGDDLGGNSSDGPQISVRRSAIAGELERLCVVRIQGAEFRGGLGAAAGQKGLNQSRQSGWPHVPASVGLIVTWSDPIDPEPASPHIDLPSWS